MCGEVDLLEGRVFCVLVPGEACISNADRLLAIFFNSWLTANGIGLELVSSQVAGQTADSNTSFNDRGDDHGQDSKREGEKIEQRQSGEDDVSGQRLILVPDEDTECGARYQEWRCRPCERGESLGGTNLAQGFEFLVVTDVVQATGEGGRPGVKLNRLHVVENFRNQLCTRILVLHLLFLQCLHQTCNDTIDRNHDNHDCHSCETGRAKELVQGEHAEHDLEGSRPQLLSVLGKILKTLGVDSHIVDDVTSRLGSSTLVGEARGLGVNGSSQTGLDAHTRLE